MKRVPYLLLFLLSVSLIVSCSKEDIESPELMYSNDHLLGQIRVLILGVANGRRKNQNYESNLYTFETHFLFLCAI